MAISLPALPRPVRAEAGFLIRAHVAQSGMDDEDDE